MSPRRETTRSAAIVTLLVVGALLASCSGSEPAQEDENRRAAVLIPPTTAAAPTTTEAPPPCTAATLDEATAVASPGAAVLDVTCATLFAMATVEGGGTPGGVGVAFYAVDDEGAWVLLDVAGLDADLSAQLPAGAPSSLVGAWQEAKARRENPQAFTTTTTEAPPTPTDDAGNEPPL